uniref:TldD/PmbA family protein n=1 Tax=candidate division WOR-3 bacterium TaxID=2052148 RepID=A0A7C4CAJ0_UNCW3
MTAELLELAAGSASEAEVYATEVDRVGVEFRQNELYAQTTRLTQGWGVRVIAEGRVGFSSTTDAEGLNNVVRAALETARFGPTARFRLPGPAKLPRVNCLDNRVMLVTPARMVEWGRDLIAAVRSRVPEIKLDLTFTRAYREVTIANTSGIEQSFARAEFDLGVTGLIVRDGLFWISDYVNLSGGQPLALEPVADRLTALARQGRARARLATGSYPVLVMPTALPNFLLPLEVATSGKLREKKTTPLLGREGEPVLDAKITLVDNGTRNHGLASAPFDGEGVPKRRNVLFDKGRFLGFTYDLATAAACDARTTGSAGRDYSSPPAPALANVEIEPGTTRLEDALRSMTEGVVVYDVIGGGQSNLLAGEVALNLACAFKVESGAVVGRVKDAMIAGNVYDMFREIEAVGDSQQDLGSHFLPFVKFRSLNVATRE